MANVQNHYDDHLGPIYEWMAGPFEAACAPSAKLFEELALQPGESSVAVDLGCGHGLQALPLARCGFDVIAIDSCRPLIEGLASRGDSVAIEAVHADIMDFERHVPGRVEVVVCMGDTLTHLARIEDVAELVRRVSSILVPGGIFLSTFRDYVSAPLQGDSRFIPVRSDDRRILTCFLEYLNDASVRVHDLIHEHSESGWALNVSSYEKLRIDPRWFTGLLREAGLRVVLNRSERGLVSFAARSASRP